jgi:putative peptide zinc metalloprotease protein
LVVSSFSRISHNYLYFFNFDNLLILWLCIVITKLIHELAHAYTAKYFGLRVPRMGVAFLVFMPCLYCDTTDAWRLARPGHRIAISAAGVLSEIIIAVAGAHVWYFSKPGLLNSVAFYLMVVSLTSTIFINGNPLIKLDGYFVLIDWLKLPNLASKSTSYLKYLFMNRTLGIERIANPALDARERAIFAIYGIAKTIYRLFLYTAIICAVYYKFDKTLGLALAITAFALFMVLPLIRGITTLYRARSSISPRFRGALACLSIMGALIMFLFIPWSAKSSYPCYLESSRTIKITTPLDVAIREVWIRKGDIVKKGEPMFRLDPVELELELSKRIIERKILENEIILMKLSEKERSLAPIRELEFKRISMETRKLIKERQIAASGAMAPFRGVVTKLDKEMQPGARPGKGSVMGELKSLEDLRIYALIPENDIHRITKGQPVTIYFPASDKKTHKGKVEMIRRFNERDLRDSTFSSARGGPIATEKSSEEGAERPLTSHYICSTSLNDSEGPPLGATGLFIVTSKPVSVMGRLYGSIVRTFNRESLI